MQAQTGPCPTQQQVDLFNYYYYKPKKKKNNKLKTILKPNHIKSTQFDKKDKIFTYNCQTQNKY